MRAWCLALALGCVACSPTPKVGLVLAEGQGVEVSNLSRLRLIVRTCDSNQPALAENVPLNQGSTPRLEATVVPGTSFYVWLQGWEACTPPCVEEATAQPDDCTCLSDEVPTAQIFLYEACSDWMEVDEDVQMALTLSTKGGLCPPPALPRSDCKTP